MMIARFRLAFAPCLLAGSVTPIASAAVIDVGRGAIVAPKAVVGNGATGDTLLAWTTYSEPSAVRPVTLRVLAANGSLGTARTIRNVPVTDNARPALRPDGSVAMVVSRGDSERSPTSLRRLALVVIDPVSGSISESDIAGTPQSSFVQVIETAGNDAGDVVVLAAISTKVWLVRIPRDSTTPTVASLGTGVWGDVAVSATGGDARLRPEGRT